MEVFVLFVATINVKQPIKALNFFIKLFSFFIIFVISLRVSAGVIVNSEAYYAAVVAASERKTIIIDAGHGGEDCGAIGVSGVYEKDLNFSVANTLGEMLTENGFAVIYTRTEDKLLYTEEENIHGIRKISDLKNRCKIGAEHKSALFVSIHMNSYQNEKYSGLQVYYGLKDESSESISRVIQKTVKDLLQNENKRSVKAGKNMYLLENLENPAVLIECGFLSNREECEKLSEKEYQKQLCFSILCAIIEYNKTLSED